MKAASSIIVRFAFLVCFLAIWGCGSRKTSQLPTLPPTLNVPEKPPGPQAAPPVALPAAPPIVTAAADCRLLLGQVETFETVVTVGLSERVDPSHAPHPTNESERLLFRQLYETLVRADCNGRPMPGLAASWRLDSARNIWIVTLRPNAWFSNNKPVTAMDVVSSWMKADTRGDSGRELRPEVRRLVRSVVAMDDRTLEVDLQSRRADAAIVLAHTDLAIAAPVAGSSWPLGTRPLRMDSTGSSAISLSTLFGNSSTRFLIAPGRDSRDLLDQGSDLLLTRDPRTVDYAVTLPQFQISPLPWQRTYVLLTPNRAGALSSFSADERRALAQDAVRGPARGAEGPFWWESLADCEIASPQASVQPQSPPRIVYDVDDSAARELAERFVGIGKYPRASGLAGDALAQALRRGNESAYILSLDRRPLDACREMQMLTDNSVWIDPQSIIPLVDTRLQAIVRRGRSGLIIEWDGALLLETRN